ncbi:MAG: ATP-binding cassette domain-containing protein [Lachnospiraceae bacterium]|nr:ATP-binding cassette domain-containing protein [Lachnospiraceae bacterium]
MLELKDIYWNTPEGEAIVKGISLSVPEGKLTVITGPNGGGKTSLSKLIAGIYRPNGGQMLLDGQDITEWDITKRAQNGIAYAFQQPVRFKGLTVRDLLELSAEETIAADKLCSMLGTVGLCAQDYMDRTMDSSLSGGESKRIEIATVLCRKNAEIMVFDEPEAGIDLWSFSNLINAFERLKTESGRTLIIISHQERIMAIADYIAVVADGKLKSFGSREEILPQLLAGDRSSMCPVKTVEKEGC